MTICMTFCHGKPCILILYDELATGKKRIADVRMP